MTYTPGRVAVLNISKDCDLLCIIGDGGVIAECHINKRLENNNEVGIGGEAVKEANARRLAALWNAAESLGLSTSAIESGVIEDMLKMLVEIQEYSEYWSEYDVPLGIKDRLDNVIKKILKTNDLKILNEDLFINDSDETLKALENIKNILDNYVPTCPLCGGSLEVGHKKYCAWWIAESAIQKERSKE